MYSSATINVGIKAAANAAKDDGPLDFEQCWISSCNSQKNYSRFTYRARSVGAILGCVETLQSHVVWLPQGRLWVMSESGELHYPKSRAEKDKQLVENDEGVEHKKRPYRTELSRA